MAGEMRLKQGAALVLTWVFTNADGSPMSLLGVALAAQLRDMGGNLVAALPFAAGPAPNMQATTQTSTAGWPVGMLRCDLAVTGAAGLTEISRTFPIHIEAPVTVR